MQYSAESRTVRKRVGLPYSDNANALFTAVSRLNKKLDDNKADVTITYERGKDYALESI